VVELETIYPIAQDHALSSPYEVHLDSSLKTVKIRISVAHRSVDPGSGGIRVIVTNTRGEPTLSTLELDSKRGLHQGWVRGSDSSRWNLWEPMSLSLSLAFNEQMWGR